MTIANAWRVMRLGVVSRRILLRLLLFVAVMTGCASGPRTIDLMPAPAVFADGAVNLLPKGTPPSHTMTLAFYMRRTANLPMILSKVLFISIKPGFLCGWASRQSRRLLQGLAGRKLGASRCLLLAGVVTFRSS